MKNNLNAIFLGLLISSLGFSQNAITGTWVGGLDNGNEWSDITIHLAKKNSTYTGKLYIPSIGITDQALKNISVTERKIHFEWERSIGTAFFDGEQIDGGLKGTYKRGNVNSTFILIRKVTIPLQVLDSYTGSYQIEPGRFLSIGIFGNDDAGIRYEDSKTRRQGILYAVALYKFIAGPSYGIPLPADIKISVIKNNGNVTAVEYKEDGKKYIAKKIALHKQEEIKYKVGNAEITGTLFTPIGKGKYPSIILVRPGYSFVKREGVLVPFFLRQGLAVFTLTEKIQNGKPQNYNSSTFEERAQDIVQGLNALKNKPEIDPKR